MQNIPFHHPPSRLVVWYKMYMHVFLLARRWREFFDTFVVGGLSGRGFWVVLVLVLVLVHWLIGRFQFGFWI